MRLSRRAFIKLGILAAAGLAVGKGFVNSRDPELVRVDIGLKRLPPSFDGLKVAQITDIHSGRLVPTKLIRAGVDLVQSATPDLIVLTGDFITGASLFAWGRLGGFKPRLFKECLQELAGLSAPFGVYAVLGNHDFWSGPEVTAKVDRGLRDIGVKVLRNEMVTLVKSGQKLHISGIDDYWERSCKPSRALRDAPISACKVLLSHNPDVNQDLEALDNQVDLVISGHTHGGQVVLPLIGAPFLPSPFGQKYRSGLVRDGERQTYISRGLGVFFVPIRINCPSEITLLTLRRA
ncbi:MAG: metallophosphoesterase [Thermodesulfobacteriota bacterium]|nr:metallophosphoesterase [Thermodesulfobacteriota bacterium]